MREKLAEYEAEGTLWPHSAAILDPVRLSIVVSGPAQIVQAAKWFTGVSPPQSALAEAVSSQSLRGSKVMEVRSTVSDSTLRRIVSNCCESALSSATLQPADSAGKINQHARPKQTSTQAGGPSANLDSSGTCSSLDVQNSLELPVVRVKNKFNFAQEELKGGYRDLMLSVLHDDSDSELCIIGEIQVPLGWVGLTFCSTAMFHDCRGQ